MAGGWSEPQTPTRRRVPLDARDGAGEEPGDPIARLAGRLPPELVLSSPLLRARQTADAVARAAGCPSEVDERLAPGATAEGLLAAIEGRGETIAAVGHQPDCGEIALALTGESRPFPPAGLAVIDLPAQ